MVVAILTLDFFIVQKRKIPPKYYIFATKLSFLECAARMCRAPRTGKQVKIPARKAVTFKKGTLLNNIKR